MFQDKVWHAGPSTQAEQYTTNVSLHSDSSMPQDAGDIVLTDSRPGEGLQPSRYLMERPHSEFQEVQEAPGIH